MTKRYGYATVYIDHASHISFIYLQKSMTSDKTLEGKLTFQQYAKDRGVTIQAYHAHNGISRAQKWVETCCSKGGHKCTPSEWYGRKMHQDVARTCTDYANAC